MAGKKHTGDGGVERRFALVESDGARDASRFDPVCCPNCRDKEIEGAAFAIEARRLYHDRKTGRIVRDKPIYICSACGKPLTG